MSPPNPVLNRVNKKNLSSRQPRRLKFDIQAYFNPNKRNMNKTPPPCLLIFTISESPSWEKHSFLLNQFKISINFRLSICITYQKQRNRNDYYYISGKKRAPPLLISEIFELRLRYHALHTCRHRPYMFDI